MYFVVIGVLTALLSLVVLSPIFVAMRSPRLRMHLDLVAVGVAVSASLLAGALLKLVPFY